MNAVRVRILRLLRRLDGDEQGNVLVLYIMAALLLVGMLWAIIGTGQRVVQKEVIQTSADAAAFSAAVIKAKGMNIIAFCNLAMALLLAVIMLLRLLDGALATTLFFVTTACIVGSAAYGTGSAICALAPPISSARSDYHTLDQEIEPRILDVMNGLADLERAVQESFPALALIEAYQVGTHSEYQKNFGKGQLVTVTWPLPVGDDLKLPAQDGTWDELCDHGARAVGNLLAYPMDKIGLSGGVGDAFSGGVYDLIQPLKNVLCPADNSAPGPSTAAVRTGGSGNSCSECASPHPPPPASNIQMVSSTFSGMGGSCTMAGPFPASSCSSGNLSCSDGTKLTTINSVSCSYSYDTTTNLGGQTSSKPKPLDILSNWQDHSQVRAFTLLTDTNMGARRAWAGLATKNPGSAAALNQLLGMSQAEFFAFNGHPDLWHMDWRARLVRFTFGDTSQTDTSSANGVPANAAGQISGALASFLSNDATAALANEFLLH